MPVASPADSKPPVVIAVHLGFGWIPIVPGSLQLVLAKQIESLPAGLALDPDEKWFSCVDMDGAQDKMIQGRAATIHALKLRVVDVKKK